MRRFLLHCWAGACLLFPLLASGCQNCQPCCSTCCTCMPAQGPAFLPPASKPVWTPIKMVPTVVPASAKPAPTPAAAPMLSQVPSPGGTSVSPVKAAAKKQPDERPSLPAAGQEEEEEETEETEARPRFAHDPKYHWLVGILDYSRIQQAWVLRYVSYEKEDRYGGCVTLVAPGRAMSFKPGQVVRVEGSLIDPDSQQLRPAFQVRKIRAE